MKNVTIFLAIGLLLPSLVFSAAPLTVTRVVDGETLELSSGEQVCLIGVDAPEASNNLKLWRDAGRTGQDAQAIMGMGKEAAEFTRKWAEGKQVRLEYDVQRKDPYGRALAYVYVWVCGPACMSEAEGSRDLEFVRNEQGLYLFLNAIVVKNGYARAEAAPPNVKYRDFFVKLEKDARERKKGLWGEMSGSPLDTEDRTGPDPAPASNTQTGLDYKVSENATVGVGAGKKTNGAQAPDAWEKPSRKGASAQAKYKLSF